MNELSKTHLDLSDRFHLISITDSEIVGICLDEAIKVRITKLNKKFLIELTHLGSGVGRNELIDISVADPRFFDLVKEYVKRFHNERNSSY